MSNKNDQGGTDLLDKEDIKVQKPKKYKVVLHNDNFTTMQFVVIILMQHFHKGEEEAFKIMLNIHEKGKGIAGIYSKEIAETKAERVKDLAKANGFPLLATIEPE